jgi:DNA-binding CsgD family transcriptional regulator
VFDSIGLDAFTEAVYLCILRNPSWGVAEIVKHLGSTDARIRQALDDLADLRLLRPSVEQPTLYRPVSPEVGFASLLARGEAELLRQQQQMAEARAAIASIAVEFTSVTGREEVVRLDGLDAVRSRLEQLAHRARSECLSFMPGGGQQSDTMDASQPLDQEALARGVGILSVYQDSFRNDPATVRYAAWLTSLGGQARSVPTLPMLLVIVDREVALVPCDPHDGRAGALEVCSPGVVTALCALFDRVWEVATPFGAPSTDDCAGGLTSHERALLRLLMDGDTDEVAARKLGVSARTVRRTMSEVMARLDVRSRFQAGARAVQKGWL